MPTFYFSGINRYDLIALLAEQQAAGMVNARVACEPRLIEAYQQFPDVPLVLDCDAFQRLRSRRSRLSPYQRDAAIDQYAAVIAEVGWRFAWWSSFDVIGDQAASDACYERLLQRLDNPQGAARILWIYQGGSLQDLEAMAARHKRVGIGGMVPLLQRAGSSTFLRVVAPLGEVLMRAGAQAHIYGLSSAPALATLAPQPWFASADGATWLIAYRAGELLQASGTHVNATRLGLRLSRRAIAANNIQVTQEWIDPLRTHQFSLFTT